MEQSLDSFHTEATPEPVMSDTGGAGLGRFFRDVLETLILSVLLFVGINAISARIRVDGNSMEPTLHTGEFVIVNRLAYKFGEPDHGDVVVFRFPRDPEQEYIKRVIGLSGDHIRIYDGKVFVNDQLLDEPYIAAQPHYESNWQVPEGQIFVLGDNRNNSSDSHNWGPVPVDHMIGKAIFVYWPPRDVGLVASPQVVEAAPYSTAYP